MSSSLMGEYLVLQSEHTQNVCQDKMWDCGMRQLDLKKEKKTNSASHGSQPNGHLVNFGIL